MTTTYAHITNLRIYPPTKAGGQSQVHADVEVTRQSAENAQGAVTAVVHARAFVTAKDGTWNEMHDHLADAVHKTLQELSGTSLDEVRKAISRTMEFDADRQQRDP